MGFWSRYLSPHCLFPSPAFCPPDSGYVSPSSAKNGHGRTHPVKGEIPMLPSLRRAPTSTDFGPAQQKFHFSFAIESRFDGPAEDELNTALPATLPRLNSRNTTPFQRQSLQRFDGDLNSKCNSSLSSPDRFLPRRRPTLDSAIESFRANKDPCILSPEEKLSRNKDASLDAFNPRRRATSPIRPGSQPVPRRNISGRRSGSGGGSVLTFQRDPGAPNGERQVSIGTVWRVGGLAPVTAGVPDGRGGLLGSGTNAPLYTTSFSASRAKLQEDIERHENRLAQALDLDRTSRVLEFRDLAIGQPKVQSPSKEVQAELESKTTWTGTGWTINTRERKMPITQEVRTLPIAPFKVLDAPNLRDDFYCSVLAYCTTSHTLAVGLGALLYAWSEMQGVHLLNGGPGNGSWLTSLAFSSFLGSKSILAFGRSDGSLSLISLKDPTMLSRFEVQQPCPIACVIWKPTLSLRPSRSPTATETPVKAEDLLVGDEIGNVYYYSVEWPEHTRVNDIGWSGAMTLLARVSTHTQQICGLSFSWDGSMFATGGNDNLCCLFQTHTILQTSQNDPQAPAEIIIQADGVQRVHAVVGQGVVKEIRTGSEKHRWTHGAAVKAIAFCPWRDGLVATGGGSNDKCIHFFHTASGACLATISVAAQVTSLIWSTTRREIAATFGYAQPDHPYRIAVFSWPECKQVAAIPWEGEHRALYAIPYPGGPNESQTSREGGRGLSRTAQEGCIVVASSDESVKFHEVWTANQKATTGGEGLLGGSDILEGLEGNDKEGEVIR